MKWLATCAEAVAAVLLAAVTGIVLTQVVTRYVLRLPISWPEESARFVAVWLTFVGAAAAGAKHEQIAVDVFGSLLQGQVKKLLPIAITLCGLTAVGVLLWSVPPLIFGKAGRSVASGAGIEVRWVYLALPVGCGLVALFLLSDLWRLIRPRALQDHEPPDPRRGD